MPTIKWFSGAGFVDQEVASSSVGELRNELDIAETAAVSVNGINTRNSTAVAEGDFVAAVSNNKTGGNVTNEQAACLLCIDAMVQKERSK